MFDNIFVLIFGGGLDVKDFFYNIALPESLRRFFHLPSILAGSLHREGFCKERGQHEMLNVRIKVVPMGWNHALDLAQNLFEGVASQALSIPRSRLLKDGQPPASMDQGVGIVYVDNFVYLSEKLVYLICSTSFCFGCSENNSFVYA